MKNVKFASIFGTMLVASLGVLSMSARAQSDDTHAAEVVEVSRPPAEASIPEKAKMSRAQVVEAIEAIKQKYTEAAKLEESIRAHEYFPERNLSIVPKQRAALNDVNLEIDRLSSHLKAALAKNDRAADMQIFKRIEFIKIQKQVEIFRLESENASAKISEKASSEGNRKYFEELGALNTQQILQLVDL